VIVERAERYLIPLLRGVDDSFFVEVRRQFAYRSIPQTSPLGRAGTYGPTVLLSTISTDVLCVLEITGSEGKG
jgi:hypothetical protein